MRNLYSNIKAQGDDEIEQVAKQAEKRLSRCDLCPRKCGIDRLNGDIGFCKSSLPSEVFYAGLLINEEHDLNPAYEVFFTGCNLGCRFCYLADKVKAKAENKSFQPIAGHPLFTDPGFKEARTVAAVGGEPACNLAGALTLFSRTQKDRRVWNSNMYYGGFVAEAVTAVSSIVVADVHFGNDACAEKIGAVTHYLDRVIGNIRLARAARLKTIVRLLPLPGHFECCGKKVVEIAAEHFADLRFHVLENYLPPSDPAGGPCPELSTKLPSDDVSRLKDLARQKGLIIENDRAGVPAIIPPARAESAEIIIGPGGEVTAPHLTPGVFEMLSAMKEVDDG